MFGSRPDGKRLSRLDPIVRLAPYLMPTRNDAMVMSPQEVDYDAMAAYVQKQRREGRTISFMTIIIAAYVRVVSQFPEINRFVANKQIFARNEIAVAFNILKRIDSEDFEETVVKLKFDPVSTVFDVARQVEEAVSENRKPEEKNLIDKITRFLLSMPGLPNLAVGVVRFMDRYGLMPRIIHEASPFHTGLYLTNMASLGMNYVYHHIYNFGTTSVFVSMGKIQRSLCRQADGSTGFKRVIPLGVVTDDRICSGANYARAFALWRKLIQNPTLMEMPPENVVSEMPGVARVYEIQQAQSAKSWKQA